VKVGQSILGPDTKAKAQAPSLFRQAFLFRPFFRIANSSFFLPDDFSLDGA
jgi:hypothetical protein